MRGFEQPVGGKRHVSSGVEEAGWALECVSGIGGRSQEVVGARMAGWWELLASWGKGRSAVWLVLF